jgi:hypothetical protein
MREGESQIERETGLDDSLTDLDTDVGVEREREQSTEDSSDAGVVRSRLGKVATTRSLGTALALSVVGVVAFGFVPILSIANTLLGIAAAGFAYGLGSEERRYVEMALAGAVTGGATTLLGNLAVAVFASGGTLLGVALLAGAAAGAVGHYFGRDLRAGLTADLD